MIQKEVLYKKIEQNQIIYLLNIGNNTSSIIGNKLARGDIEIPRSVTYDTKEYIITSISEYAFYLSQIRSVIFSTDSELQTIEKEAFSNSSIEYFAIPFHLKKIGENAFSGCLELHKLDIQLDSDLQIIEKGAFSFSGIENFSITSNLTKIGEGAFYLCKKLCEITVVMESKLQIIEKNAFRRSSINFFALPNEVTTICQDSFSECDKLSEFIIESDSKLQAIEKDAFSYSRIKKLYIPSNFVDFKEDWCDLTYYLYKIDISPDNKRYSLYDNKMIIGKSSVEINEFDILVFCSRDVERVIIPSSIKIIKSYAFEYCQNLKTIEFQPNSKLEIIEKHAFSNTLIESFILPSSVKKICEKAFNCCKNLSDFVIQTCSNLQVIESEVFCETPIYSLLIPSNFIDIQKGWNFEAMSLSNVIVMPDNPRYCCLNEKMLIRKSTLESKDYDDLVFYYSDDETITIPSFIKRIEMCAFQFCLCNKVDFSQNSQIKTIDEKAFYKSEIRSLTIPSSLIDLKEGWFEFAPNLTDVNVSPDNPRYSLYDNKIIIGKSSVEMNEFDILVFCSRDVERVIIPSSIKIIKSYAFEYCQNLKKIEFQPNSKLEIIEKRAFSKTIIKTIFIPSHVTQIGDFAFLRCNLLEKINFEDNSELKTIKKFAFLRISIEKISIPSHVVRIEEYAFDYCTLLRKIDIPHNSELHTIELFAFSKTSIESIIFPPHLTKICLFAFTDCLHLKIVEFDENSEIEFVDKRSFDKCEHLIFMIPVKMSGHFPFILRYSSDDVYI